MSAENVGLLRACLIILSCIVLGLYLGHRAQTRARHRRLFACLSVLFILAYIVLIHYFENYVL